MGREEVIKKVMLERQPSRSLPLWSSWAGTTVFLCSDAAAQITGTTISVDGAGRRFDPSSSACSAEEAMAVKRINLALQGGGAHGAFTWGVLDRLLEDEEIEIAAISGTSAGALNGAAFKAGMVRDGRQGARETLDRLWGRMGAVGDMRLSSWFGVFEPAQVAQALEYSLPFSMADALSRMVSPYQYGPLYVNPLKPVVDAFDYKCVCADEGPDLFICATRVRNGKIRVFTGAEISTDVILASACLPTMFKAVEIEDSRTGRVEAFWDGGYTGKPGAVPVVSPAFAG